MKKKKKITALSRVHTVQTLLKQLPKMKKKHNKIIQQQNNRLNTKHVKTSVVKSLVLVLATHSYNTLTISDGHSAHLI